MRIIDKEIEAIARQMEITPSIFKKIYCRRLKNGETTLKEKRNFDCILLDRANGCTVYHLRPRQCRTWPFWQSVIKSAANWQEAAKDCPGMNQGKLYSPNFITGKSQNDGTVGSVLLAGLPAEEIERYAG